MTNVYEIFLQRFNYTVQQVSASKVGDTDFFSYTSQSTSY